MKQYHCLPNKSDGIFSASFPHRFRIISVSFSYHPPIAKRKTIRNGAKDERIRFGGTRVVNFTIINL